MCVGTGGEEEQALRGGSEGGDGGDGGEDGEGKQWIGLLLLAGCAGLYHQMQRQAGLSWSWRHFSYVRYVDPAVLAAQQQPKRRESISFR